MRNRSVYALLFVALILVALGSYQLGLRAGFAQAKQGFGAVLASIQAELGLNNLQSLQRLETDLTHGCSKEALAKTRFDIDLQMYVLASLYRDFKGTWAMEGIAKRDPSMLARLEGFKKQYGERWTEPKCGT